MLLKQFSIAHCYEHGSYLSILTAGLRERCTELCPEARAPKLGNHITLLPPFRAHEDEMRQFAMGLSIARALYGSEESHNYADSCGIDFFRNPEEDVCILRVALPRAYHAMIEECRRRLSDFNEWVFPVLDDSYNPHICILEGAGLYEKLRPALPELKKIAPLIHFTLPFPQIMEKITVGDTKRWVEFDPTK